LAPSIPKGKWLGSDKSLAEAQEFCWFWRKAYNKMEVIVLLPWKHFVGMTISHPYEAIIPLQGKKNKKS